jgi:hypothetical protein
MGYGRLQTLMKRATLEALAEAIVNVSGYREPGSALYDARNPGGLKDMVTGQPRVFRSVIDGMQALFYDVELKCSGRSRAHLLPTDTLVHLANSYNLPITTATAWSHYLRRALHEDTIRATTPLSFFQG